MKHFRGDFGKKLMIGIVCVAACILLTVVLTACKLIHPNRLLVSAKNCRGVDISHYQGKVDMAVLAGQGIEFVYCKATEGSGYTDEFYAENRRNASDCGMLQGAYHFFSFESDAKTQAAHFIETVGDQGGFLVPVVDVEYYGDRAQNAPDEDELRRSLQAYLDIVEEHYGRKPMIYTTVPFYNRYLRGYFGEYPLWIRNVYFPADLAVGNEWVIWQFDDRFVLEGYEGQEKYIDMNVFRGDRSELEEWVINKK